MYTGPECGCCCDHDKPCCQQFGGGNTDHLGEQGGCKRLELAKVAFVNAGDLIDARTASLKSDAAPDDLAAVQSVKVKTFGEDGLEQEVKLADKLRALDLLGKHLGMFNGASGDTSDQLAEARKLLGGMDSVID